MDYSTRFISFPLYHGTSSLYLADFRPGTTPQRWPYKEAALNLLRGVWDRLAQIRDRVPGDIKNDLQRDTTYDETPWYVRNIIEQASGTSNWQHGDIYLTASKRRAARYACGGARYGGELLTACKEAIDALSKVDRQRADRLIRRAESLDIFLKGTDLPPILVEFTNIGICGLLNETGHPILPHELSDLADDVQSEPCGSNNPIQEIRKENVNFRLASGCGVVRRVFEVNATDAVNGPRTFSLEEIHSSDAWA